MHEEPTLGEQIEEEFHRIQENRGGEEANLYKLLTRYIQGVVRRFYRDPYQSDKYYVIEEITQDALFDISRIDLVSFEEKNNGKFTTYCGAIAKNKTIDAMRWQSRNRVETEDEIESAVFGESVEAAVMAGYAKLELIERTKRYLKLFVELPEKPYRLVSCCFSLLLYHRYFPETNELSSPGWAFSQLAESNVELGADRFIEEINEWIPYVSLYWSDEFLDGLEQVEFGQPVGQLIFGEHFKKKDIENWGIRIREKIKKKMSEAEYDRCVMELS